MIAVAYVGSKNGRLPYSGFANAARQASKHTCAANDGRATQHFWLGRRAAADALGGRRSELHAEHRLLKLQRSRVEISTAFLKGLSTLVSYTWGKSIDVSSGYFNVENGPGGSATIQNYYDQSTARGVSSYDITHFLSWANVYELPFGRGKRWFRRVLASWLLGDWQMNSIVQARSGAPYNLVITGDLANLRGNGSNGPNNYLRTKSSCRSVRSRPCRCQSRSALSKDNFQWRACSRCSAYSVDLVQSMRLWNTKQHRRVR